MKEKLFAELEKTFSVEKCPYCGLSHSIHCIRQGERMPSDFSFRLGEEAVDVSVSEGTCMSFQTFACLEMSRMAAAQR